MFVKLRVKNHIIFGEELFCYEENFILNPD